MNMLQVSVGGRSRATGLTCLFTHCAVGEEAGFEGMSVVTLTVNW